MAHQWLNPRIVMVLPQNTPSQEVEGHQPTCENPARQEGNERAETDQDSVHTNIVSSARGFNETSRSDSPIAYNRTEDTDIPESANTSLADQDLGAGASNEKSPHSQADAKPAETAMPEDTTQVEGFHAGEFHEKPQYSQTETEESNITLPVATSEADQKRNAREARFQTAAVDSAMEAKQMHAFMKSRLGTEVTHIPVSVDTSQADQESGAGDIREKSPHSHADAKASESVDTSYAERASGARKRRLQPTAVCSGLSAAEVHAKEMKSRLAALFDTMPDSDQEHDIIKPLLGKLFVSRVILLKGSNGCGKTTAALMLARQCVNEKTHEVIWMNTNEVAQNNKFALKPRSYIFIDDFLGKSASDSFARWKRVCQFLRYGQISENYFQFVLTTRASILDDLIARTGAELLFIKDVVTISIDRMKLWKNMKITTEIESPLDSEPPCGFPLCCRLVPHVHADSQRILFQQPMFALRQAVRKMNSSDIARLALTLLALSEDGLDRGALLNPHQPKALQKLLQNLHVSGQTLGIIVSYYQNCPGFIQVQGDLISFTNEAVRDAVLVVLSECQAEFLSTNCCIKLQSQLALATSDDCEDSEKAEKPKLPNQVLEGFVQSIMEEIKLDNFQLAFSSALLQHRSFKEKLESTMMQEKLVEKCLDRYDREGLHFLFHAGAVDFIWEHSRGVLNETDHWLVLQALLACCYWGHDRDVLRLLQVFENEQELKKVLKDATIQKIVSGNLPDISMKKEPDWERTPMYPEDTLLTMAAWRGNDAVVKLLVNGGMEVNNQGKNGHTALMHYCARGNSAMVEFLLDNNANASLSDEEGLNSLMHALCREEWTIPEKIFTDSNCNSVNAYEISTLMTACAHRWSVQTIQKLIACGVDVKLRDCLGYTCLHHACVSGCTDIVSSLLKISEVNSSQTLIDDSTPLMLAVTSPGRSQLVQILLWSLNPKKAIDQRVIQNVCLYADKHLLYLMFQYIDANEESLLQALQPACESGNVDIVRFLIVCSNYKLVNATDKSKRTCLHLATSGNNLECIKFLLELIHPNCETTNSETPLMFALRNGRVDFARQLRSKGAKTDAVDCYGNGCLHYAIESQSLRALQWCIEEERMEVNMRNKEDRTPLHKAVETTDARLVQYLLDKGADIKAADVAGDTALHLAARLGVKNVLDVLLTRASNEDLKTKNLKGLSPEDLAATISHPFPFIETKQNDLK